MDNQFALTTNQAARLGGVEQHVLRSHLQRHGHWNGAKPRKLPNGKLLWPRAEVLKAAGLRLDGSASTVPANASISFLEEKGLDCADPILHQALAHLHSTEADFSHGGAHLFTEAAMLGSFIEAFAARLNSAETRITKREFERCCQELAWRFEPHAYLFGFIKAGAVEGK